FSAFIALGLPFMESEKTVSLLGLALSEQGLWLWFGAVVKSTLGVAALLLLVATTPFPFLQEGFYGLRFPEIFLDLLGLTHRLLFVLTAESTRVRRAAKARGFAPRWLPQARGVGKLIGNIFLRSYRRAERIYAAMRLRGYKRHMPRAKRRPLALAEVFGLILFGFAVVLIRIFAA
ncbi:MAG: hypothetical protein HGA90_02495, partial [Alphaproteobacteria bacterium]|nr:hypothetical protein [Alphaproteobacteria bacterium]